MNANEIVRCWKDDEYRESLSDSERAILPENPAGFMMTNEEMGMAKPESPTVWTDSQYRCTHACPPFPEPPDKN